MAPTHPVVKASPVLGGSGPALKSPEAPDLQASLKQHFTTNEQALTQAAPLTKALGKTEKAATAQLCTSCRKTKHYGPCLKPAATKPGGDPHKRANFNIGMYGADGTMEIPATSARFHSAMAGASRDYTLNAINRAFDNLAQADNTSNV